MRWYDVTAPLYDLCLEWMVHPYRAEAVRALELEPDLTVLDVACGTGLNFPLLLAAVGGGGMVIGLDASPGMLALARRKAYRQGWRNVRLIERDACQIQREELCSTLDRPELRIDRVICTLGLSAIPDWWRAFERTFDLLAPGGRYVIMDGYEARPNLRDRLLDAIARSDVRRRIWQPLRRVSERYVEMEFTSRLIGRTLVVAGSKPVA